MTSSLLSSFSRLLISPRINQVRWKTTSTPGLRAKDHLQDFQRPWQGKGQKFVDVPSPRGSIATPEEFLTAIGRKMESFAPKFESWDHLFTVNSHQLEQLGLNPKSRKYLLSWRHRYAKGIDPVEVKIPERNRLEKSKPKRPERLAQRQVFLAMHREKRRVIRMENKSKREMRKRVEREQA